MQEPQEMETNEVGTEVESLPDMNIDQLLTGELKEVVTGISEYLKIIKEAKTNAKKNLYKKKVSKLQKQARMILYSQYLNGKKIPLDLKENKVE